MRSRILILAVAFLVACQPVPRPFEGGRETPNELLKLSDSRGIMVLPVSDAPPATAEKLAAEMAAALIEQNIPASVASGNHSSLTLASQVIDPGRDAMIAWTLFDAGGKKVARHEQIIEGTPIDLWAVADPDLMARLAGEAAPEIAVVVQGESVVEVRAPPIFVGDVSGTNEKDTIRLQAALRQALRRLGARIANAPSPQTLVASANVAINPLSEDQSEGAITWAVRDPFGTEIGKIEQASLIARNVIAQEWGSVARQAGIAAAAGIIELISQIDWSQGFVPPAPNARTQSQSGEPRIIPSG